MAKIGMNGPSDHTETSVNEEGHPVTASVQSANVPEQEPAVPETTVSTTVSQSELPPEEKVGEQSSQQDGTDSLTSSESVGKNESITESASPSPAPTTANPFEPAPTVSGSAPSTVGSGTEQKPTPTISPESAKPEGQ